MFTTRNARILFFCISTTILIAAQLRVRNADHTTTDRKFENIVVITIPQNEYERIKVIDGQKKTFRKAHMIVNGDSIDVEDFHTRGNTSLSFRRKSFSFSLKSHAKFYHRDRAESMKKFDAISLSMDAHYFKNRVVFELMEKLHLLGFFYAYGDLRINGKSEGIYLILERPQDWALKHQDSPLLIRRGYNHRIDKIKTGKHIRKPEAKDYKSYYTQIYKSLDKHEGKELYDVLSKWVDLEMYMKWLAFNFIIKNGDYTDEVYFYISPAENRFKIIPWDYDDIFARTPHEGLTLRKEKIGNTFIFSSEDKLDQKIANDHYLYQIYLTQFKEVLTGLDENMLKHAFENAYAELYPYYTDSEIIGMAKYDAYKYPDLASLKKSMDNTHDQIVVSRNLLLKQLDN